MYNSGQLKQFSSRSFLAIGSGTGTSVSVTPFTIPKEAQYISFILGGAGGGGAGGTAGADGTARRGGGGGASGSVTTAIFLARMLPSTLFLILPEGGNGGLSNQAGSNAGQAAVNVAPNATITGSLSLIFTNGGNGGAFTGGGGTAAAVTASSTYNILAIGRNSVAGIAGQASGNGVSVPNHTITFPIGSGASGGSTSASVGFAGQAVIAGSPSSLLLATTQKLVQEGALGGGSASHGYDTINNLTLAGTNFFHSLPGAGGGAFPSGTGGNGGNGGVSAGGGGGGAGVTGGQGGKGGSSFCLINWW